MIAEAGASVIPAAVRRSSRWPASSGPDGGFPLEIFDARTSAQVVSRGARTAWGPKGSTRTDPLVSLEALRVLEAASLAGLPA